MFDIFMMDMGNEFTPPTPHTKVIRFYGDYPSMVKKACQQSKTEYCWVIASFCDYTGFDFYYHPELRQTHLIHCWSTGKQQWGDTFLVRCADYLARPIETYDDLGVFWYGRMVYHTSTISRQLEVVRFDGSDLCKAIKSHHFNTPLVLFVGAGVDTESDAYKQYITHDTPSMWPSVYFNTQYTMPDPDKKYWRDIYSYYDGQVTFVPREAKDVIVTQVYDYPYINFQRKGLIIEPMDIMFISYDEVDAERNWKSVIDRYGNAKWVHGVDGMINAIKEAAKRATTPWFYAVFGKTNTAGCVNLHKVRPDYLRHPANYVSLAYNATVGIEYGHDGVVLYDREWVLNTTDWGLDFTMSHHVVTVLLRTANLDLGDHDPWAAWRTAFREAYKLSHLNGEEDIEHLSAWLTRGNKWTIHGAKAGRQHYLDGNLMDYRVNDWKWLKERYESSII